MTHTPRGPATRAGLVVVSMLGIATALGGCPAGDGPESGPPATQDVTPVSAAPAGPSEPDDAAASAAPEPAAPTGELAQQIQELEAQIDDAPPDEPEGEPDADALRLDTTVLSSTPIPEAVSIEAWEGALVHDATGMSFPKSAAGWARLGSKRYDAEGHDVGIGYTRMWRTSMAAVTVYVYPRGTSGDGEEQQSAAEHLDDVGRQISARYGDVEVISGVGGRTGLRGVPVRFAAAEHELPGGPELFGRRAASFTSVIAARAWWIKVRVTTPVESRDVALAAVEELLAELRLPATGLPATHDAAAEDSPDTE